MTDSVVTLADAAPATRRAIPSDGVSTLFSMPKRPSRIDLLELDIDLRLADLWREADDITEWNIEIVAAFMRAAYGKGYCDALTEEPPGELSHEPGSPLPPHPQHPPPPYRPPLPPP